MIDFSNQLSLFKQIFNGITCMRAMHIKKTKHVLRMIKLNEKSFLAIKSCFFVKRIKRNRLINDMDHFDCLSIVLIKSLI